MKKDKFKFPKDEMVFIETKNLPECNRIICAIQKPFEMCEKIFHNEGEESAYAGTYYFSDGLLIAFIGGAGYITKKLGFRYWIRTSWKRK